MRVEAFQGTVAASARRVIGALDVLMLEAERECGEAQESLPHTLQQLCHLRGAAVNLPLKRATLVICEEKRDIQSNRLKTSQVHADTAGDEQWQVCACVEY